MESIMNRVASAAIEKKAILVTAESCTGGWIAREFTSLAGSSDWFDCSFVTYSNHSKQSMLGVSEESLIMYGAVSAAVVAEMAEGALRHSQGTHSVATSGIAGPGGGTAEKPVGTVWFAWAEVGGTTVTEKVVFSGDRESVRKQAVSRALEGILTKLLG